jgi:hypothetical protein
MIVEQIDEEIKSVLRVSIGKLYGKHEIETHTLLCADRLEIHIHIADVEGEIIFECFRCNFFGAHPRIYLAKHRNNFNLLLLKISNIILDG